MDQKELFHGIFNLYKTEKASPEDIYQCYMSKKILHHAVDVHAKIQDCALFNELLSHLFVPNP
jgi:hypothetical protein